jgi:hypothetical protein
LAISKEAESFLEGLEKEAGISGEALKAIREAVGGNPKADEFVKGSVLRQSDYSRRQAELQSAREAVETAQRTLADKEASVSKYQTELGQWKAGADSKVIEALTAREQAETKLAAALARLSTVGGKYGVDPADLELGDIKPVAKTETPAFDDSKYVKVDDLGRRVQEAGVLDAMIYDLGNEHLALFGKPLPKAAELVQESIAKGVPLTKLWEEKYKVVEKRNEVVEASVQQRIANAVVAERTRLASAGALPSDGGQVGFRDDLHGSPILEAAKSVAAKEEVLGGVSAAIAAFNSGKYKASR